MYNKHRPRFSRRFALGGDIFCKTFIRRHRIVSLSCELITHIYWHRLRCSRMSSSSAAAAAAAATSNEKPNNKIIHKFSKQLQNQQRANHKRLLFCVRACAHAVIWSRSDESMFNYVNVKIPKWGNTQCKPNQVPIFVSWALTTGHSSICAFAIIICTKKSIHK